jgi:hypothetical protein
MLVVADTVHAKFKEIGYNLNGYRSGSLKEVLAFGGQKL